MIHGTNLSGGRDLGGRSKRGGGNQGAEKDNPEVKEVLQPLQYLCRLSFAISCG